MRAKDSEQRDRVKTIKLYLSFNGMMLGQVVYNKIVEKWDQDFQQKLHKFGFIKWNDLNKDMKERMENALVANAIKPPTPKVSKDSVSESHD